MMKILVLLPRFPYPLDKGDKLRAYHQIVELAKRHEIYLFALSHTQVRHDDYDHLHTYCTGVDFVRIRWWESAWGIIKAFFNGRPLQLGYWTSTRARRAYRQWEQQVQPDVVYCQMVRTIPTVEGSRCRKVLDFQDSLSLNTHRRMERSKGLMRIMLKYEYKALQRVEQQALTLFDATTVISAVDRDAINPSVHLVPNGVDTDYFNTKHLTLNTKHSICFCGNMSYAPNVDAACFLVREVMPLVWEYCPYATVLIAGADPTPAVRALASKALKPEKVTVSGRMPDIRDAYASSQLFVAPMRIGSGLQNKLLEAMAMQKPCVTTSLANAALGATSGDQLFVGDSKEDLAHWICLLLGTEDVRTRIAEEGYRFVRERYSWPVAVQPLEQILQSLTINH